MCETAQGTDTRGSGHLEARTQAMRAPGSNGRVLSKEVIGSDLGHVEIPLGSQFLLAGQGQD